LGIAAGRPGAGCGGLNHAPAEGQALASTIYVLLAPLLFWAGASMLAGRLAMRRLYGAQDPSRS